MAIYLKLATGMGSAMVIIGCGFLGIAGCSPATDQGMEAVDHSATNKYGTLTCEEIKERFGDKPAELLTDEFLAAELQNELEDPEFRRLFEEEGPSEEAALEELRCSLLTAAWGIGVQATFRHFIETIPAAKRATVEERLFLHSIEQMMEASSSGNHSIEVSFQQGLNDVRALLEDYLTPEELEVLTAGSMMGMREIEAARRYMEVLFQGEELAEQDAEAIAAAFGREEGRAYEGFFADPENTNLNEELIAAHERALAELSNTLSPEAMVYAERLYEFYMMARDSGD